MSTLGETVIFVEKRLILGFFPRSTVHPNSFHPIFSSGKGLMISREKMTPHFVLTKNQIHERCKSCSVNSSIHLDGGLVGSMEFVQVKAPYHDTSFLGRIVKIKGKRDIPKRELITKAKTYGRFRENCAFRSLKK